MNSPTTCAGKFSFTRSSIIVLSSLQDYAVIVSQVWFGKAQVIQGFLFEFDRLMFTVGSFALIEDVFDVFCAKGPVGKGFFYCLKH